jgi:hypothetical protein
MRGRLVLVLLLTPALAAPASAGIIFGKKSKPNPAERVPELLGTVKTDGDEHKRAAAAEELRQYDPTAFPDIVPVLIDVLQNDKKPSVRAEAAQSLGKLRPISQQAGQALEQALAKDSSMRVRLQARSALVQYHWSGYRSKKEEPPTPAKDPPHPTKEPPLAGPPVTTKEPPLAPPVDKPAPPRLVPQPAPSGPVVPPLVPTVPPPLKTPPPPSEEKGPELSPPN